MKEGIGIIARVSTLACSTLTTSGTKIYRANKEDKPNKQISYWPRVGPPQIVNFTLHLHMFNR